MNPIPMEQQQSLVSRLTKACGGAYSPEVRRKYFISGPQWAAAYNGSALFHAPTRPAIGFEDVIRKYAEIGIQYWCTHDTDVIATSALGRPEQAEILGRIKAALDKHGVRCSMVTAETFYDAVWAAGPAAESPDVREYATFRVRNNVEIGHELGASFAVYWPGSLGYYVQGAVEETNTLRWYAEALNAACEHDIEVARQKGRPTLKHCLEAKPVRAPGRDPAAYKRRHARVHFVRAPHAPGDGGPESGVPARTHVGRCASGSAGAGASRRASSSTSTLMTATA